MELRQDPDPEPQSEETWTVVNKEEEEERKTKTNYWNLKQVVRLQGMSPYCHHFSVRQLCKLAYRKMEAGRLRKWKIISKWKSAKGQGFKAYPKVRLNQPGARGTGRIYPLHLHMIELIDKHTDRQVEQLKTKNGPGLFTPELIVEMEALKKYSKFYKSELDSEFTKLESKISIPRVPSSLCDPISENLFADPVITPEGRTYERSSIEEQLIQTSRDPFTDTVMTLDQLIPNIAVQDAVEEFVDENEWAIDFDDALDSCQFLENI